MIPRRLEIAFGLAIAALMVAGPYAYRVYHTKQYRNFRTVEEGVLYRSAQLSLPGLKKLLHDYRFKTIVCLRNGDKADDQKEEAFCKTNGIEFVRIPVRSWTLEANGTAPVDQGLAAFRDVMSNPKNHPVLLHCFAGTHRTGAYTAIYRMDFQGWDNDKALRELRALGYVTLDEDRNVFTFLRNYQAKPTNVAGQTVSRTK